MTVFTDNIIFLVSGVQRLSHSGDTISISRNLTIANPSTFVSAVPLTFSTSNTSASLIQTIQPSDLATNVLAVRAQDAYAGAVTNILGGNLTLSSGLGTTAGNSGSVLIQTGGTTRLSVSPTNVAIPAITNAAYLKTDGSGNIGAGTSLAVSNLTGGTDGYILITNGTTPTWTKFTGDVTNSDTGVTTVNSISGSTPILITPATVEFTKGTVTPTITQAAPTTDVATTTLTISGQPAYSSAVTNTAGGNLILQPGTSAGANTTNSINLQANGNSVCSFGYSANSITGPAMYCPNGFFISGTGTMAMRSTSGPMNLSAFTNFNFGRSNGNSDLVYTPANAATLTFGNVATTSITINQTALASGSTASATGTAGVNLTVQAQAGQTETGTTSIGGAGGNLILSSGAGGTGTSTNGIAGNVDIQAGGTNIAIATPNQFQTTKGIQTAVTIIAANTASYQVLATDYVISISANTTTGTTVTLPSSPSKGDTYIIKDSGGTSFTWNITVDSGSGNLIDGSQKYTIATNYASLTLVWINSTTKWSVL